MYNNQVLITTEEINTMKIQHNHSSTIRLKPILFLALLLSGLLVANAQTTYTYEFTYDGNPLVRHHDATDPDVHVWYGTVWMYCSQDHDGAKIHERPGNSYRCGRSNSKSVIGFNVINYWGALAH